MALYSLACLSVASLSDGTQGAEEEWRVMDGLGEVGEGLVTADPVFK